MRRLARFLRLEAWERRVFVRAMVLLPASMLRIRRLGVRRALLVREGGRRRGLHGLSHAAAAQRIAALVELAARHGPFRASCLPISVTVHRLLRERGIESRMRIGVRKSCGRLEAHAWVERDGVALLDSASDGARFAPFDTPIDLAAEPVR